MRMMPKAFHREGDLSSWWHYVLPAEGRYPGLHRLVDEGCDLVVVGPKGVGKTTLFLTLARELKTSGRYAGLFVRCRPEWKDPDTAIEEVRRRVVEQGRKLPWTRRPPSRLSGSPAFQLRDLLSAWSLRCDGRAVLLLDDLDEVGPVGRLTILRQVLRCRARPEDVPLHLVAVIGGISVAEDARRIEEEARSRSGRWKTGSFWRQASNFSSLDTYVWIDTDSLVKKGEDLTTEHLGIFYGVSKSKDEATRQALAAILVSECLGRRPSEQGPASFQELFKEHCRDRLPTLAHLGLEIDKSWLSPDGGETDTP